MTRVADLSWDAVEARLEAGALALLPIGAGSKEHGLHLPMGTDDIQATFLADEVAQATNALVWPCLTYGFYPAFRDFPGSVTLSAETFTRLVREVAAEILRWRPLALLVLDTGISTIAPVARALDGLAGAYHIKVHDGPRYRDAVSRLQTQRFGSHADEMETSRMLALAPSRVDMVRAAASPARPFDGPMTRLNAPSGSYGDPTLATFEKGRILLDAMVADLIAAARDAKAAAQR